jgi:hypothetical protein
MRHFAGIAILAAVLLLPAPAAAPAVVNDGHGEYVLVPAGAFRMATISATGCRARGRCMWWSWTRFTSPGMR